MPGRLDLSLEELARIALGGPELTVVNVAVLHSLLNVLMKKLNCQHDRVNIGGFESKCLEKILQQSKMSTLPFDDNSVEPITDRLICLEDMQKRIAKLEENLECHFKQIRICNKTKSNKYTNMINHLGTPCEDLCTTCDEDSKLACSLLHNIDFMKKLLRLIAPPILDRVDQISTQLERFYEKLKIFLKHVEGLIESLEIVKQCVIEIESLREVIKSYNVTFIGTMEELQDMLDSKLDKVHMPALKKYIRDRFDDIDERLQAIEMKETCPRAAGFINTGIKCLSCGNSKIGADIGPQTMALVPNAIPSSKNLAAINCQKQLLCRPLEQEPTLMVRINNLDLKVLSHRLQRHDFGKICKLPEANDTIYGVSSSTR